jgi:hypothetical protein
MTYKSPYKMQEQYEWSKKGKSYKTKYFGALKLLLGKAENDQRSEDVEGSKETENQS